MHPSAVRSLYALWPANRPSSLCCQGEWGFLRWPRRPGPPARHARASSSERNAPTSCCTRFATSFFRLAAGRVPAACLSAWGMIAELWQPVRAIGATPAATYLPPPCCRRPVCEQPPPAAMARPGWWLLAAAALLLACVAETAAQDEFCADAVEPGSGEPGAWQWLGDQASQGCVLGSSADCTRTFAQADVLLLLSAFTKRE